MCEEDFRLDSYDYELPQELIAQYPAARQEGSRLMLLDRADAAQPVDCGFNQLADYLPKNALVIANNSRVLEARLNGQKPGGGKVEFLLLTPLPLVGPITKSQFGAEKSALVECLLKGAGKLKPGARIRLADEMEFEIISRSTFGRHTGMLRWQGDLGELFKRRGQIPLPPYIHRAPGKMDASRYQTCFAKKPGSVAAPTAGLHFTPETMRDLARKGVEWHEITLYVGYGTFSPVRCQDIRQHKMHSEYVEISETTAMAINKAREQGRPVLAIGTTSLRALEGVARLSGEPGQFKGWIDIFIYPGFNFKVVDGLLTNFHLPKSSLLMLVSAFAGTKRIMAAYKHAIEKGYHFFSYGDAMLISKNFTFDNLAPGRK